LGLYYFVVTLDERHDIVNYILHTGLAMRYTSSYYRYCMINIIMCLGGRISKDVYPRIVRRFKPWL